MATKTDMITFIIENSSDFQEEELLSLSYKEIKKIFDKTDSKEIGEQYNEIIEDLETNHDVDGEKEIEEIVKSNDNLKLVSSEDYGDDGIALTNEQIDELIFEENEEEVVEEVEWNYDDLSPNDKRLYRRTGIKRMGKINKYTRFGKEKPKL